jgi:S1-C subfamily serine protease
MFRQIWPLFFAFACATIGACTHAAKPVGEASGNVQSVTVQTSQIQNLNQASRAQKNLKQSLVRLRVKNLSGQDSYGTGFFFKNRSLLVTALHTLDQNACIETGVCEIVIGLVENSTAVREVTVLAKIALRDPSSDLLFLEIKDEPVLSRVVPLKKSSRVKSDQLTAVGFYQDSQALTFSHGVSQFGTAVDGVARGDETTTTIIVSQGFSGAPVVNAKGEVVGVVSSYHPLANNKEIGIARFVELN